VDGHADAAGFAMVGSSFGQRPPFPLPKMFPCCWKGRLMLHVYRVVCYMGS